MKKFARMAEPLFDLLKKKQCEDPKKDIEIYPIDSILSI